MMVNRLPGLVSAILLSVCAAATPRALAQSATLTHYYNFTSGVIDQVGTANGALLNGANVSGGRLNLDGINDYVQFNSFIIPTSGSYSFAFLAQRSAVLGPYTEVISQGFSGGPGMYLGTSPQGTIRAGDMFTTNVPFGAVGVPTHYALVVDALTSRSTLYVNGTAVASIGTAVQSVVGGTPTRLGRQFEPYGEYFAGFVDELRIYNGALTGAQVAALASAVPEPATAGLMSMGLLALALCRRKVKN